MKKFSFLFLFVLTLGGQTAIASEQQAKPSAPVRANADVVFVKAKQSRAGLWNFAVSVSHPDTGWDDYADGWDVIDGHGIVIKDKNAKFTRLLTHPHVGEIPFTRAQNGLQISTTKVTVRAHDLVDGFGGQTIIVDLNKDQGPGYSVQK